MSVSKWVKNFLEGGRRVLLDRSSRTYRSPRRVSAEHLERVERFPAGTLDRCSDCPGYRAEPRLSESDTDPVEVEQGQDVGAADILIVPSNTSALASTLPAPTVRRNDLSRPLSESGPTLGSTALPKLRRQIQPPRPVDPQYNWHRPHASLNQLTNCLPSAAPDSNSMSRTLEKRHLEGHVSNGGGNSSQGN